MRILLISPHAPPYGGIANWTNTIIKYSEKTDDDFFCINIAPKKRCTEGRNLFDRIVLGGIDMLKKRHELKKKIKEYMPDVIHLTSSGSLAIIRDFSFIKLARKYNIPIVYHLHFGGAKELLEGKFKLRKLFMTCLFSADAVVCIDKKTMDFMKNNFSDINLFFVPNPIDIEETEAMKTAIKKQVLFLGWVIPTKGVEELLDAWNQIGLKYPEYDLIYVGPYSLEYLQTLKSKLKVENVIFTGEKKHTDALQAVSESEIFILPSYTEGFPYSILEAMALHKPIVATDVGDIPNMLSDNCGIIIEPKNVNAIIESLEKLLSDSLYGKQLGENAYMKVKNEFSVEVIYTKYEDVWQNVRKNMSISDNVNQI